MKPIPINNWPNGIADSPYLGVAELRNVDVVSHPGAVVLTPKLFNTVPTSVSGTFTAVAATDIVTGPNLNTTVNGNTYFGFPAMTLTTTGTLPAGLSTSTIYYAISVTSTTYKLASSLANAMAGTQIDITTTGTGTHTLTTIAPGTMQSFAYDNMGTQLYGIDDNGRVWQINTHVTYLISGNTLGTGNGLAVFKNYLFAFRNNNIDVYGPLSSSPSWSNSWQALHGGTGTHKTLVGQDDILYFGDDDGSSNSYIGSIQQATGSTFTPGTLATYVYNIAALTLPKYKIVNALAELGVNLMIGTSGKETYPWDRKSATFDLPIICAEKNVTALVTINNQLYIAAGTSGNIYAYNGYQLKPQKIFPKHLLSNDSKSAIIGAMTSLNRKLLFTVQTTLNSGVYSIDLVNNTLVLENTISNNSVGPTNPLKLPSIYSDGTTYIVGWNDTDASTKGLDRNTDDGTFVYPTSGNAHIITQQITIGSVLVPGTIGRVELALDRPLLTSQSAQVLYRTSLAASFTSLVTFAGDNSTQIFSTNAAISTGQIQFKIIVTGTSSATPFVQTLTLI